jgi:hypothetical protein
MSPAAAPTNGVRHVYPGGGFHERSANWRRPIWPLHCCLGSPAGRSGSERHSSPPRLGRRRRDELALVLHALCESLGLVAAKAMSRSRAPRSPPTAHLRRPPSAGSTTPPATACWDLANSARCSRAPPAQSETVGAGAIMLVPQRMQGLGGSAHREVACVGAS